MSKVKDFFANLKKSTKITLISCASFVLMTFLILCFFIVSPITPSDKAGNTYGRESVSPEGSTVSADVTTLVGGETVEVSKGTTRNATTTVTTTHKDYEIIITTGTGRYDEYYEEGKLNTGGFTGEYQVDPFVPVTEQPTEAYTGGYEPTTGYEPVEDPTEPYTGEDPTEPPTQEPQPITEPITQAPTEPITQAPTQAPDPPVPTPTEGGESSW